MTQGQKQNCPKPQTFAAETANQNATGALPTAQQLADELSRPAQPAPGVSQLNAPVGSGWLTGGGDASRSNNPNLNRNIAIGAGAVGTVAAVGGIVALNVVGFPEVEGAEALMAAIAGEPVTSAVIAGASAGSYGAVAGGILGYQRTQPMPSTCP